MQTITVPMARTSLRLARLFIVAIVLALAVTVGVLRYGGSSSGNARVTGAHLTPATATFDACHVHRPC